MDKLLGIKSKWECVWCGNIIYILDCRIVSNQPKQCGCGKKRNFKLIDFEKVELIEKNDKNQLPN